MQHPPPRGQEPLSPLPAPFLSHGTGLRCGVGARRACGGRDLLGRSAAINQGRNVSGCQTKGGVPRQKLGPSRNGCFRSVSAQIFLSWLIKTFPSCGRSVGAGCNEPHRPHRSQVCSKHHSWEMLSQEHRLPACQGTATPSTALLWQICCLLKWEQALEMLEAVGHGAAPGSSSQCNPIPWVPSTLLTAILFGAGSLGAP